MQSQVQAKGLILCWMTIKGFLIKTIGINKHPSAQKMSSALDHHFALNVTSRGSSLGLLFFLGNSY